MKTLASNIASRVISTTIQQPSAAPVTDSVELELTEAQARLFPQFLVARDEFNKANNELERVKKELDLPKYEGEQTVSLYTYIGKGRKRRRVCVGEIQVSPRAGFSVPPGWTNKIVNRMTVELAQEILKP